MNIEKAYNHWAALYDTNDNKTRDLDQKSTVKTLDNYPFSSVVELGCGTGKNTAYLLTKAEKIIALDFSQEMVQKAKEKINDQRVIFKKVDLTRDWGIEPAWADLITASLVLEHIQDLDHVFKQAHQSLMKNGLFFISELHPFKQYLGSKARFEMEGELHELDTFTHHISEFLTLARKNKFELIDLNECFDVPDTSNIPRLISLVFRKG